MRRLLTIVILILTNAATSGSEPAAIQFAAEVVEASGGAAKLLRRFRMQERFNFGTERTVEGTKRTSILELPKYWWVSTQERGEEPAKIPTWAWTLVPLTEAKSRLAIIPDVVENDLPLAGIRIEATVSPALDMYFNKETLRLARIDWGNDIYLFSDWENYDGCTCPARCTILKRDTRVAWFHHQILGVERLSELPANLQR